MCPSFLYHTHDSTHDGTDANAALCFCSLLSNLRKLTLAGVAVSLPALQPVATCLHELMLFGSRLQGSADGFLTKGWTAPTSLKLTYTHMEDAILTAALELPVLEDMHIYWFMGHRGGKLQLHQLTGGCPQVSRLEFELGNRVRQAPEASRQSCGLLNLKRLADLHIRGCSLQANMDLDLPPSLTQLKFGGSYSGGSSSLDFFWALWEAAKCVGRGAQLHRLTCACAEAHLQPARWGASLDEQHRRLGGQLSSLKELVVLGAQHQLLSAVGALASAAPSLVRLEIVMMDSLSRMEVSPICSASLESIRVEWGHFHRPELPPPQVVLTLLPGCTRLQEVVVHCTCGLVEGATVKIRCHCCSRRCIMPQDAVSGSELAVRFVPMPQSEQGVQEYTVLSACHAAGAEQTPLWGHAVMPGIL